VVGGEDGTQRHLAIYLAHHPHPLRQVALLISPLALEHLFQMDPVLEYLLLNDHSTHPRGPQLNMAVDQDRPLLKAC
jgi:hypothetical protein